MKQLSLMTLLSATTLLTACGGGGGSSGGSVPVTTLPDFTTIDSSEETTMEVTVMEGSLEKSNREKREELYDYAVKNSAEQAENVSPSKARAVSVSAASTDESDKQDQITSAYKDVKALFLTNKNFSDYKESELKKMLFLIGYKADELPTTGKDQTYKTLVDWCDVNSPMLQARADRMVGMYGEIQENPSLENATLKALDINSVNQDTFLNFVVDQNGNISGLDYNIETTSSGQRTMHFKKQADGTYKYSGKRVRVDMGFTVSLDDTGATYKHSFELEFLDDVTAENFADFKKRMIVKLYEDIDEGDFANSDSSVASALETQIKNLTWEAFELLKNKALNSENNKSGNLLYEVEDSDVYLSYISYAQKGEVELWYSDFGITKAYGKETNGTSDLTGDSVFAGGYEVAKIDKSKLKDQTMTFTGKAVATALYQHDYENDDRQEYAKTYENGVATLKFDNGAETLTTDFKEDNWYTIVVTTNKDDAAKYDISFTGGERIEKETDWEDNVKYTGFRLNNEETVTDFVGWKDDGNRYGSLDIGYYGTDGTPAEATGYVGYGEKISDGESGAESLHLEIGFGMRNDSSQK